MSTNIQSAIPYAESPASWNCSYVNPDGFICRITLRADNGKDLLEKANNAMAFLLEHGCKPEENRQYRQNNNKVQSDKFCQIHPQCNMKKFEKDGKSWFSHKTDDGHWCYGKQKGG